MVSVREASESYEPVETKNIADLDEVSTELDLQTKEMEKKDGTPFKYDYIVVEGEEYRVPASVLKQLKEQLAEKPDSSKFKVKKSGEGMKTEYTVIMLD